MSSQPIPWDFHKPKTCKPQNKLFALQKPFMGKRLNRAKLVRKITHADLKHSMGLAALAVPIPQSWSWRKLGTTPKYSGKIEQPRDQGQCGCCWAFAVSMALGDRYSIKYNIPSPYISPLSLMVDTYDLMQTTPQNSCNNGGDPFQASQYLETTGINHEKCWPFSLVSAETPHQWVTPNSLPSTCCSTCCGAPILAETKIKYKVHPGTTRSLVVADMNSNVNKIATIAAIQREIMANGPVICGFTVYNDFMDYWKNSAPNGEIYVCDANSGVDGGHAVTITGWGVGKLHNGKTVRYWELRNSWGTYTGDGGYGKVAFSTDVQENADLQLDIPQQFQGGEWSGGMISIVPGNLPSSSTLNFMDRKVRLLGASVTVSTIIYVIGGILLLILLLIVIGMVISGNVDISTLLS